MSALIRSPPRTFWTLLTDIFSCKRSSTTLHSPFVIPFRCVQTYGNRCWIQSGSLAKQSGSVDRNERRQPLQLQRLPTRPWSPSTSSIVLAKGLSGQPLLDVFQEPQCAHGNVPTTGRPERPGRSSQNVGSQTQMTSRLNCFGEASIPAARTLKTGLSG